MGGVRVTQNIITSRVLNNLQDQTRRILGLQDQLSTGQRVNSPSDDPLDARRAVNLRALIQENEQFVTNINDAGPVLTETSTSLQQVVDIIHRSKELTLQGANGTNSQRELDAIALEINELLEAAVVEGNHQTNGRFIFAGTQTLSEAFSVTRAGGEIDSVTFEGNTESIEIAISRGITAPINEPGSRAFQDNVDLFQVLIDVRDDLRAGNQNALQTHLADLDTALDQTNLAQARVGATQNRIEAVSQNTEEFLVQFEERLSDAVDADFAETIVDFNAQSNAFQAALNSAARVIQPSLLDFVR